MKADAADRQLGCMSCHGAHAFDTQVAAVQACMVCHDDAHTRAYTGSKHHTLWKNATAGGSDPNRGVSCATCHLPREMHRQQGQAWVAVQHNQNDNLLPNEKMIRSVCLNCYGLRFAIDALADADLVASNFTGRARTHVDSIDWAVRRDQSERNKKRRKDKE